MQSCNAKGIIGLLKGIKEPLLRLKSTKMNKRTWNVLGCHRTKIWTHDFSGFMCNWQRHYMLSGVNTGLNNIRGAMLRVIWQKANMIYYQHASPAQKNLKQRTRNSKLIGLKRHPSFDNKVVIMSSVSGFMINISGTN